ncbi:AAA family ATPase [Clostridium butyricum]|uniref:McrB family protein n=1 Tax=Clostridium butyricum TaxID=1492 RepID=UPI003D32CFF3
MEHNYLYYGPPGCGKTYVAKKKVIEIIKDYELNNLNKQFTKLGVTTDLLESSDVNKIFNILKKKFSSLISFVSLHEGYSYNDFVEGIEVSTCSGMTQFQSKKKILLNLLENIKTYNCPGFLILDDIDRVNIGLVFGEILNALENRGSEVTLMSGKSIVVPKNLYVIATMGTLQVSNKPDYAFLRRFKITKLNGDNSKLSMVLHEYKRRNFDNILDSNEVDKQLELIIGTKSNGLYDFYNSIAKNVTYEFEDTKHEYEIGYSYFIPQIDSMINDIEVVCQHKIHHQVIPLLQKYAEDGVIDLKNVPTVARTNTVYTRKRSDVLEPRIKIFEDTDTAEYGRDMFERGIVINPNTAYSKSPGRGREKVNRNYLMVYEIVRDIIQHNLINDFQLMDLFIDDREIICTRKDLGFGGGGLFVENKFADILVNRAAGNTHKNDYSLYNSSLHKIAFKDKKYRMVSRLSGDNNCPQDINRCVASDTGQNSNPMKALKMLVYNYLFKFKCNLVNYMKNCDIDDRLVAVKELQQLNYDLDIISKFSTEAKNVGQPHYIDAKNLYVNAINKIRSLTTWDNMINGNLKGVYKNMDFEYKKIMDITGVHQMILQGPPGTSKTYGAKEFLSIQAGLINMNGEKWDKKDIESHKLQLVNDKYQISPNMVGTNKVCWDIIQFHPSYCYEDFVRGITVSTKASGSKLNGKIQNSATAYEMELDAITNIEYKTINKTFGRICEFAQQNTDYTFYLVIDEINRANLATVFGELIYALEYREEEVTTPYTLDFNKSNTLKVPNNLYVIGTMNTADKSIGNIDYAIRRRFLFFPSLPSSMPILQSIPYSEQYDSDELKLFYCIEKLFDTCLNTDDYIKEDVQIGHTYFIRATGSENAKEEMKFRFLFQVVPVIREYIKDGVILFDKTSSEMLNNIFELVDSCNYEEMDNKYNFLIRSIDDGYKNYILKAVTP